jgi:predicted metalloprotease
VPPEIVMGDGVLAGFKAVGVGDVAGQAILAHEYGHHIQFQRNLTQSTLTGPEASRRLELMADAFSSYYLTHARGATMQWKRVQQFVQVFYQLGDCLFTVANHHGTPNQRLRSAEWGYSVANDAHTQGHILPSLTFAALFEQKLPQLVAPDAP